MTGPTPGTGWLPERLEALARLAREAAEALEVDVARYADWVLETLEAGGRILFCGNGGSQATCQHVAAEYVVRFHRRRVALPALALGADTAALSACANDFGFGEVFARQLEAHGRPGDLLVLHSTSGTSPNVVRAAEEAARLGIRSVGLLAGKGGRAAPAVDLALVVPTDRTDLAQELHLALEHAVVEVVEARLFAPERAENGEAGSEGTGRDGPARDGAGSGLEREKGEGRVRGEG